MSLANRRPNPAAATLPGYAQMLSSEIIQVFSFLDIPATIEDLQKPTSQFAWAAFSGLLGELMGVNIDYIEGPKAALLGMLEYKEAYIEALQFTMFYKHCKRLADICGVTSFNMSDLTRPDPARFKDQMSGIMNFAKFRSEKESIMHELQDRDREQKERVDELRDKLQKIENSIEDITARNAQDKPLMEAARARNIEVQDKVMSLRTEQIELSAKVETMKKQRSEYSAQATRKEAELHDLHNAQNSAKSRLVQSPDRIKKHISEMQHQVHNEKSLYATSQRKDQELSNRLKTFNSLITDLEGLIDLEQGVDRQRAKVEQARSAVQSLKGKVQSQQIEKENLDAKLGQLSRQIENAQEMTVRQNEKRTDMKAKAIARAEYLKQSYVTLTKERKVSSKEREELTAAKKQVEAEMAAFVATHEKEINLLLLEYWTLRRQAEEYMGTVQTTLGLELEVK